MDRRLPQWRHFFPSMDSIDICLVFVTNISRNVLFIYLFVYLFTCLFVFFKTPPPCGCLALREIEGRGRQKNRPAPHFLPGPASATRSPFNELVVNVRASYADETVARGFLAPVEGGGSRQFLSQPAGPGQGAPPPRGAPWGAKKLAPIPPSLTVLKPFGKVVVQGSKGTKNRKRFLLKASASKIFPPEFDLLGVFFPVFGFFLVPSFGFCRSPAHRPTPSFF